MGTNELGADGRVKVLKDEQSTHCWLWLFFMGFDDSKKLWNNSLIIYETEAEFSSELLRSKMCSISRLSQLVSHECHCIDGYLSELLEPEELMELEVKTG